jgi:CRISPR system Cascade subunit CasB
MAEPRSDICTRFVEYIISRQKNNRAMGARLRRADNRATEYQSWQYLVPFGLDLRDTRTRRVYTLIAAALARAEPEKDGAGSFGYALAGLYNEPDKSVVGESDEHPALPRLRRLLACTSTLEACEVLRPLLSLAAAKSVHPLSYAGLMRDLLYFSEKTRERWAQDFFFRTVPEGEDT